MTKIDDLLYKAGLTADGCWDKFDDYDKAAILRLVTFTVEECATVIDNEYYTDEELSFNSHRHSFNSGICRASSSIKKHFGIKE